MITKIQAKNRVIEKLPELNKLISDILNYEIEFKDQSHDINVHISTEDLTEHTGVLKTLYKNIHLSNDGGGIVSDKNLTEYYLPLHFKWDYHYGSNGKSLCRCWYSFDQEKWIIKMDGV